MDGTTTAAVTAEIERPMPAPTPGNPFPTPWPGGPTYSALDLMGETYLALWSAGKIPDGPMRDPEAAQQACASLLRAFGVIPTDEADGVDRAACAVAVVCGAAA